MGLKLKEFAWNGSAWKDTGNYLEFDPNPSSVTKETKIEWRARHTGLYSTYPKCKYRYRRTVTFTLKGGCNGLKRKEIEFYAMRNSKFRPEGDWGALVSPDYYSDKNKNPYDYPWQGTSHPYQVLYVMFEDFTSEIVEGKVDWFTYTVKLKVVNDLGISS